MRFYGLLAIFLMFTQASQASPGSIFDSLVEQTNSVDEPLWLVSTSHAVRKVRKNL